MIRKATMETPNKFVGEIGQIAKGTGRRRHETIILIDRVIAAPGSDFVRAVSGKIFGPDGRLTRQRDYFRCTDNWEIISPNAVGLPFTLTRRVRIMALGEIISVSGQSENTVRFTASKIGRELGRKYRVNRIDGALKITRTE